MKHWHTCQRWEENGFVCPFSKLPQHEELQDPQDERPGTKKIPRSVVPEGKPAIKIVPPARGKAKAEKKKKIDREIEEILRDVKEPVRVPAVVEPVGEVPGLPYRDLESRPTNVIPPKVAAMAVAKVARTVPAKVQEAQRKTAEKRAGREAEAGYRARVQVPAGAEGEAGYTPPVDPRSRRVADKPAFAAGIAEMAVADTMGRSPGGFRMRRGLVAAAIAGGAVAGAGFYFNASQRMNQLIGAR